VLPAANTDPAPTPEPTPMPTPEPTVKFVTDTLPQATQGQAYSATLSAANGEGALGYSIAEGALPPGLTLSREGVISGKPTAKGKYSFTARVTDGKGNSATKLLSIFVTDLCITTDLPASVVKGESGASNTLNATGGAAPYTFEVISGSLPTGITILPDGGPLGGTFDQTGTHTFTIKVTDSAGIAATRQYTIEVKTDLSLGTMPLVDGNVGIPYIGVGFYASGGVMPLSFAVTENALPEGLSMDADGNITGTPAAPAVGTHTFTVTVTDGEGYTASQPFSITIYLAPPP
jgi:hypothetical protein